MVSEAQKRAKKKYEKKAYFQTLVRFPKEKEETIRMAAAEKGMSLNEFINRAVEERCTQKEERSD